MLTRRAFLEHSALVSLSPLVPTVLGRAARAAGAEPDNRVLVVIQLDGGNDGLNTVAPYRDDAYARHRPQLRLETARLHKLNDQVALHPSMQAAKQLYDDGRLAIVQCVGYPNPDRSHFRSMRIWQTAQFDDEQHDGYGWLGQALDRKLAREDGGEQTAVFVGEQETPVALWGRRSTAAALSRLEDIRLELDSHAILAREPNGPAIPVADGGLQQFVTRQVLSAYAAAADLARASGATAASPPYPATRLGSQLKLVAQLLKSGSRARVFYTIQSGYDTHAAQLDTHAQLLREFSTALGTLLDDLRAVHLEDRVVVLAFSEFGRRVQENDSRGTDHGTAGPVFVAGAPVRGGLIGPAPDLSDLEDGDLKTKVDFRQVYASLLENWLGVRPADVLGGEFAGLSLIA
jgi:uncharacterized protein (DUF1501 family)